MVRMILGLCLVSAWSAGAMAAPPAAPALPVDIAAVRAAIQDLAATFGPRYPDAARLLADLDRLAGARDGLATWIDLNGPDDAGYREALEIIRAGQAILAASPGADSPAFRPCEEDQRRLDYHAQRREIEERIRLAITRGQKVYDEK